MKPFRILRLILSVPGEGADELKTRLLSIPKFDITSVARTLQDEIPWQHGSPNLGTLQEGRRDIPVMPPYPEVWMEWSYHTPKAGTWPQAALVSHEIQTVTIEPWYHLQSPDGVPWLGAMATFKLLLDGNGVWKGVAEVTTNEDLIRKVVAFDGANESTKVLTSSRARAEIEARVVLHTLMMLNCRNVSLADPPRRPKALRRKAERRGEPEIKYKVLRITAPGSSNAMTEGKDEVRRNLRLHMVRGNFATYTPERPLFGRVTGTFWRPAHVRGKRKHGIVVKTYQVNQGKGESHAG